MKRKKQVFERKCIKSANPKGMSQHRPRVYADRLGRSQLRRNSNEGENGKVIGVDMNTDELAIAKKFKDEFPHAKSGFDKICKVI